VNASRLPSRASRASLGASAVRYSFTVTDFHRLPFAGLPAHPSTTSKPAANAERRHELPAWSAKSGALAAEAPALHIASGVSSPRFAAAMISRAR